MQEIKNLRWKHLQEAACIGFNIFESNKEIIWAEQAWKILIEFGLARYSNKHDISQVTIHFLALNEFYIDFCSKVWGKYAELDYIKITKKLPITQFYVGQIIAKVSNWDINSNNNTYLLGLKFLSRNARYTIAKALLSKFKSEEKLFLWIYRSLETEIDYQDNDDLWFFSVNDDPFLYKTEQTILDSLIKKNYSTFEWLINLCRNQSTTDKKLESNPNIISNFKPEYTLYECADDTGFNEKELEDWISIIERKKQAIFYGSPGTGKTFIADKIAKHLTSKGDGDGFYELIQFHPAYTYEDFIQGIRPQSEDGNLTYPVVPGRFLEFCKKAKSCQDTCVFIIDEINRANLAQVFGELMYLLEYRDQEIFLASGTKFHIPKNVRIIGTMNTADRSIAQIDYALRRRFAFIELRPNYEVLKKYHLNTGFSVEHWIKILKQLNQAIADKNYEIGISFLLKDNIQEDELKSIWKTEIESYLEEYFFNQPEKVDKFRWEQVKNS